MVIMKSKKSCKKFYWNRFVRIKNKGKQKLASLYVGSLSLTKLNFRQFIFSKKSEKN